jgi:hypothetical protein
MTNIVCIILFIIEISCPIYNFRVIVKESIKIFLTEFMIYLLYIKYFCAIDIKKFFVLDQY